MRLGFVILGMLLGLAGADLRAQDRLEAFPSALLGRTVRIALHEPSREAVAAHRARHGGGRLCLVLFLPGFFDGPGDLLDQGVFADLGRRETAGELAPSLWVAVTHFKGWYADRKDGHFPYERFLLEELLPALEARFPGFGGGPAARCVAGMSMGGFGALNLCGRTRLFGRCLALSPALVEAPFKGLPWYIRWSLTRTLPTEAAAFRPWSLREHRAGAAALHLTCGTEDRYGLDRGVRGFAELARRPGRQVEVFLGPGGHDWAYWTAEIRRQASWVAACAPD